MGLVSICLILSFTAYELTTYDSIRGAVGDIADKPSDRSSLHGQYMDMQKYFSENKGDVYTFYFELTPVPISKNQVGNMDEGQVIDFVLDSYTAGLYLVGDNKGFNGWLSSVIGASGNGLYLIFSLAFALFFLGMFVALTMPYWDMPLWAMLKSNGRLLAVIGSIMFILFLMMPGIVNSIIWDSMPDSEHAFEVLDVVETRVTGALLFNTLVMIVLGILSYGSGIFLRRRTIEDPEEDSRGFRQKPKSPPGPSKRPQMRSQVKPQPRPPQGTAKRRSL